MRLAFTLLAVILPAAQRCTAAVAAAHITAETGVGIIACVADAVAIRRLPQLQIAAAVDLYLAMTAVQRRTLIAPLLSQLNINAIRRLYLAGLGRNMLLLAAAILPLSRTEPPISLPVVVEMRRLAPPLTSPVWLVWLSLAASKW